MICKVFYPGCRLLVATGDFLYPCQAIYEMEAQMSEQEQRDDKRSSVIVKKIGTTTYELSMHFKGNGEETMTTKIKRLIRSETASNKDS